ncbi:MAG: CRISPR-associated endonuclease Cas2 [Burkholderiales bacterium RIFOXYC12_FULL_65_23]|uniref:CRISPR-associated endonuclease Cas2 n=1 Tax=Malikia spinosa TaxID=86180 RepID=UPI0008B02A9C|nr:MAG: CRISPR-associated endonuclease Cas2 [Burkholderiales bacterium RIFOXYC12_FULL_65_23]
MLQHWVVSYDIGDARRRVKAAQLLLNHGERVQESVYELRLHPGDWKRLSGRLNRLINPVQDQWRAWPLCANDLADVMELGQPGPHPAQQAIMV